MSTEEPLFETVVKHVIRDGGGQIGYMLGNLTIVLQPTDIRTYTNRVAICLRGRNVCIDVNANFGASVMTVEQSAKFLIAFTNALNIVDTINTMLQMGEDVRKICQ